MRSGPCYTLLTINFSTFMNFSRRIFLLASFVVLFIKCQRYLEKGIQLSKQFIKFYSLPHEPLQRLFLRYFNLLRYSFISRTAERQSLKEVNVSMYDKTLSINGIFTCLALRQEKLFQFPQLRVIVFVDKMATCQEILREARLIDSSLSVTKVNVSEGEFRRLLGEVKLAIKQFSLRLSWTKKFEIVDMEPFQTSIRRSIIESNVLNELLSIDKLQGIAQEVSCIFSKLIAHLGENKNLLRDIRQEFVSSSIQRKGLEFLNNNLILDALLHDLFRTSVFGISTIRLLRDISVDDMLIPNNSEIILILERIMKDEAFFIDRDIISPHQWLSLEKHLDCTKHLVSDVYWKQFNISQNFQRVINTYICFVIVGFIQSFDFENIPSDCTSAVCWCLNLRLRI